MAGYTRQDTANNIANGNVIDADDFDAEYDAIELAFDSSGGHTHDGTTGGGSPITKVGPVQDLVISATALTPKTTNTLDLGTSAVQFKNAWFDGTVDTDALTVSGSSSIGGNLAVTGSTTLSSTLTASTVDINGGAIDGTTIGSASHTTGKFTTLQSTGQATLATVDINGGNIDGAAIGSTSPSSGAFTTIDSSGGITGDVTGTVSDVSNHDTDDIAEGTTNLYFTDQRARDTLSASGSLSYDSSTGAFTYTQGNTDTVAEGSTNLYYTDTRATAAAKAAISVTDSGGDGSLSYSAGVITYTGPSDTETRAHFSGGTGVTITDGVVAIGQAVSTTSNVTFNDAVVNGNLTVNGTTTTVNTETLNLADNQIILNSNETGTPTQNGGIEIERGTATNKTLVWNETDDKWTVGSETFVAGTFEGSVTGAVTGNVTGNVTGDLTGDVTGDLTGNVTGNVTGDLTGDVTGDVTGDLTGNSDTATTLETARTITIAGDVTATATSFDGSADITLTTTQANNSVTLGTHTTGNYVAFLMGGTGVTLSDNTGEGATPTIEIGQAVATTSNVTFNDISVSSISGSPTGDASNLTGITLNQLSDVDTTGVTTNSILKYDGTDWVVGTSTATLTFSDAGGTNTTSKYNTFDMYEEGTFAPNAGFQQGNVPSGSPSNIEGTYTKVGNLVTVFIGVDWGDDTVSPAVDDGFLITNLPFLASQTGNGAYGAVGTGFQAIATPSQVYTGSSSNASYWTATLINTTGTATLYVHCTHVDGTGTDYDDEVVFTVTYRAST